MRVLTMILAGGEGTRLAPLTKDRAKPAVPFGGRYRIVDFVLSNFVNSGFCQIKVLTQFKSDSLNRHIARTWQLSPLMGQFIDPVPAQMRIGKDWYKGSADAVYQNLHLIKDHNPVYSCIFAGDHIYRMDVRQMLEYHIRKRAILTVAAIPRPIKEASQLGVMEVEKDGRIRSFQEKPKNPKSVPRKKGNVLASMGNYIFNSDVLIDILEQDAKNDSSHDFGKDILPSLIKKTGVFAYDFSKNKVPGMTKFEKGYWRDVGDIDSYWEANLDLVSVSPTFNLYNDEWPIQGSSPSGPPAKFVFANEAENRLGIATDSLVSEGCIISGGRINRSILFPDVRINSYSYVTDSILMAGVNVGRCAKIRKAIIDKHVDIPPGMEIGYELQKDKKKFTVSPDGIVVIPKEMKL